MLVAGMPDARGPFLFFYFSCLPAGVRSFSPTCVCVYGCVCFCSCLLSLSWLHSFVSMQGVLWPVFHHVVDVYGDQVMRFFTQDTLADLWQCYANVNQRFRDKIVEVLPCVLRVS